jgi:dienelactone hydrolase
MLDQRQHAVQIVAGAVMLDADLCVPPGARGLVLFAHGSGSSRYSPRNRHVARQLQQVGFGTLLLDLLTMDEESVDQRTAPLRFDIPLLASRVVGATEWLNRNEETQGLRVGYFGASTGAAAALVAAAERPAVAAIVSRGGRPDLADDALARVRCPTLLIVGSLDVPVIAMNHEAMEQMVVARSKKMVLVEGASHLFEEPGTLDQVAQLACAWFDAYLAESG